MTLRTVVVLLVLANVVLFGYARLDRASQSEAGRLAEQVRPESIRILTSQQVAALGPAKVAALPDVCVEWGPLSDADRARAQADIEPLQAALAGASFGVRLGRAPGLPPHRFSVRLFHPREPIALSDILPLAENLGLRVLSEAPFLLTWAVRSDAIVDAVIEVPALGAVLSLQRNQYAWRMTVPEDGALQFGGLLPSVLQWDGAAHPADALEDRGCRLARLALAHPAASGLLPLYRELRIAGPVDLKSGPRAFVAHVATPRGPVALS